MLPKLTILFQAAWSAWVRVLHFFGLTREEASPLALKPLPPGKSARIADAKRADMLKLLDGIATRELESLQRDPNTWDKFRSIRMSDDEIRGALSDHLRFRWRVDEYRTAVHRRRVVAGGSAIVAGVCVLAFAALIGKRPRTHRY